MPFLKIHPESQTQDRALKTKRFQFPPKLQYDPSIKGTYARRVNQRQISPKPLYTFVDEIYYPFTASTCIHALPDKSRDIALRNWALHFWTDEEGRNEMDAYGFASGCRPQTGVRQRLQGMRRAEVRRNGLENQQRRSR